MIRTYLTISLFLQIILGSCQKLEDVKFNQKEYKEFIVDLTDSLRTTEDLQWIFVYPKIVSETKKANKVPPPPPSLIKYKNAHFSFVDTDFLTVKLLGENEFQSILRSFEQSRAGELHKVLDKGIVVSLPYEFAGKMRIDFELFYWDGCGTGKYQSVEYN